VAGFQRHHVHVSTYLRKVPLHALSFLEIQKPSSFTEPAESAPAESQEDLSSRGDSAINNEAPWQLLAGFLAKSRGLVYIDCAKVRTPVFHDDSKTSSSTQPRAYEAAGTRVGAGVKLFFLVSEFGSKWAGLLQDSPTSLTATPRIWQSSVQTSGAAHKAL
jgi:hypothetical protein